MDRKIQLLAGCLETLVGGSLYLFGVYAPQLKDEMELNQTQINDIGAGMFLGGCLLLWPVSYISDNYGPKIPMIAATVVGTLSYLMIYLDVQDVFDLPYSVIFILFAGIGFYVIAMFTVILPTVKTHYEDHPNMVSSFLQTFYGLGNVMWPLLYKYAMGLSLGTGMLVLSIAALVGGIVNIICVSPSAGAYQRINSSDEETPLTKEKSRSVWSLLKDWQFWVLVVIFFFNFATTINFFANIGSIYESIGGSSHNTFLLMVAFGISQTVGRLWCLGWSFKHLSSELLLSFSLGLQVIANACASWVSTSPASIVVYLSATGVSYGLCWTLFYIIFGSYFTSVPPAQLFAVASILAPGIGPMVLNSISGAIYDHYGYESDDTVKCDGDKCYYGTFVTAFAMDLAGLLLLLALWMHRRKTEVLA
mmetsp:Transcript_29894/g.42024  ORF Transcript_29894/g.42024 Transcript_29894/m.42024 type:complete len:420 (+) Transcript_29894:153-1412(+)